MTAPRHERGVALLAAIILVAIATIIAATIAFKSAMSARRGIASLSFEHSVLVAEGAEALAAYALKQDADDGGTTSTDSYLDQWARPFGPMEIYPGVILEASVEDLQGRFNLNSLVNSELKVDSEAHGEFQRLLLALQLEPEWADKIADWIDADSEASGFQGMEDNGTTSQTPPYRTANTILTSTTELLALPGFGRERFQKLAPYVAALPPKTALNVCTAPGIVLDALIADGYREYGDAEALANNRKTGCFPTLEQYYQRLSENRTAPGDAEKLPSVKPHFVDSSNYFRLTSVITLGGTEFALYSLLSRQGTVIRVAQRSFTPD